MPEILKRGVSIPAGQVAVGETARRLSLAVCRRISVDDVNNFIAPRETGGQSAVGLRSRRRGSRKSRLIGFADFVRLAALLHFRGAISPGLRGALWRTVSADVVAGLVPEVVRDVKEAVGRMGAIASVLRQEYPSDWLLRAARAHLGRQDRFYVSITVSGRVALPFPVKGGEAPAGDAGIFLDLSNLITGCLFAWDPGIFDGIDARTHSHNDEDLDDLARATVELHKAGRPTDEPKVRWEP